MNVVNVNDVERELYKIAVHTNHPEAVRWAMSVARNYLLSGLPEKDSVQNFRVYTTKPKGADAILMPKPSALPGWAKAALAKGEVLHYFDPVQVQRRGVWQAVKTIIQWFNSFPKDDKRLRRIDRIGFEAAAYGAAMWRSHLNANIWFFVKDKPKTIRTYEEGFHWVRLSTQLHFEREGKLMNHCVGGYGYFLRFQQGQTEYFSLRDDQNSPHITLELSKPTRTVLQCKGNSNRKPEPQYQRFLRRFINDMCWSITSDNQAID